MGELFQGLDQPRRRDLMVCHGSAKRINETEIILKLHTANDLLGL